MTDELKKLIFSPQISNVLNEYKWRMNMDTNNKFHSHFAGEIADYYLNIYNDNKNIYFHFTLDLEIPNDAIKKLLILINIANKNSKEGFFVFDFKFKRINYNLTSPYILGLGERPFHDFLKTKLHLIQILFHNFVSGIHNLVYGQIVETTSLELLFLNNEGCA